MAIFYFYLARKLNKQRKLFRLGLWIRIRIHFPTWIRIQEGKNEEKKQQEKCNNCYFIIIYEVNLDQLHGFFNFEQSSAFKKASGSGFAENECGSTALVSLLVKKIKVN